MVTKLGQFKKLGPFSAFQLFKLSKLCYHFLSSFENENNFFLISLAIPRLSPSGMKGPNFVKCPNFVTRFCQVLNIKIFFFDILSDPPPIAIRNSLTNQFYQKN